MSGRITTVSKPPKLVRKNELPLMPVFPVGKTLCFTRCQHRSAITATLSKVMANDFMQEYMQMKPRQPPRIQEQVFRVWLQTTVVGKSIW